MNVDTSKPLFSIIIAVYNGEKYLEQTINSICNQTYKNFELIVIDGGSKDNTLNIIKKYESKIKYWISEPDKGISDAFNKGVLASSGYYINFQGDGDGFVSEKSLEIVSERISDSRPALISTQIHRIDLENKILYTTKNKSFNKNSLLFKMSLPHQGLFTNRDLFNQFGLFDVSNKFCMDYEHLLRMYQNFPDVLVIDSPIAFWRADGLGNGKTETILENYYKIKIQNKIAHPTLLKSIYYWQLLKFKIKSMVLND